MSESVKFSIEPGYSLSQNFREPYFKFIIGMPLNTAIDIISDQSDIFKSVDFLYSHIIPMYHEIIIILNKENIKLFFNSDDQRLKKIEIYNFVSVSLYYCNIKFNDLQEYPSKERVLQVFGPAKLPEFDDKSKCYLMSYSGLTFYLNPADMAQVSRDGDASPSLCSLISRNQPLLLNKLIIHNPEMNLAVKAGDSLSSQYNLFGPASFLECFKNNSVILRQMRVIRDNFRTKYVEIDLLDAPGRVIKYGDHVQKVLSELGSPSKLYYKTEDKMKIHSYRRQQRDRLHSKAENRKSDYFYNYFTLGMDVMFRYEDDTVSKIILHTNFPDDFLFNMYFRCFFTLELEKDNVNLELEGSGDESSTKPGSKLHVNTFSKWSEISSHVASRGDPEPVDVVRFQDHCHKSGISSETLAYGIDDLIFEVMPDNDHISSITMYQVTDEDL